MICPECGVENYDSSVFCSSCSALLNRVDPGDPAGAVPAGFWRRLWAVLLDGFAVFAAALAAGVLIGVLTGIVLVVLRQEPANMEEAGFVVGQVLFPLTGWLYFTLMESSGKGATLGKMALGIRVTDAEGGRITFARANARYWSKLLSLFTLYIGFIMAGFTERKRALHDMVAGTLVVRRR